jgi:hypothetical protein
MQAIIDGVSGEEFEFVQDEMHFYLAVERDLTSARATADGRRAFRQAVNDAVGYCGPWSGDRDTNQWEWTSATLRSAVRRTLLHHAAFAALEPVWADTVPIHALVRTGHLPPWMPSGSLFFEVLAAPPDPEGGWAGWKPASLEVHRCAVRRLREGHTRSARRRKRRADAIANGDENGRGGDDDGERACDSSAAGSHAEDSDAEDSDAA